MIEKAEKKYIYNPTFANWLIGNGAKVIGAGTGSKGDIYILFKDSETFQELCVKWNPSLKQKRK